MKKILFVVEILLLFVIFIAFTLSAEAVEQENSHEKTVEVLSNTYDELMNSTGGEALLENLSDEAKERLHKFGIENGNPTDTANFSIQNVMSGIFSEAGNQINVPLKTISAILAIMLLYSIFGSFKNTLSDTPQTQTLDIVVTLAITCTLVIPISNLIRQAEGAISSSAAFMLILVPVMAVIMVSTGRGISAGGYYTTMMAACQGVSQLNSHVIIPLLNIFLGLSVVGASAPAINFSSITERIGKIAKWFLCLVMAVFTGVLSLKTAISASADTVSSRAVKFSLSSLIPVVGSSLSEAYLTVQSSMSMLKSGIGVMSILSVIAIFLPSLMQCLMFLLTLNITKCIGEILNADGAVKLLSAAVSVITMLLVIILCVMAAFIISTSIIMMAGGGAS